MNTCKYKLYFASQWLYITQPLILAWEPCADLVKSDQGEAVRKLNVQMAAIVRLAVLMLDLACGDQGRQIARYLPVKPQ